MNRFAVLLLLTFSVACLAQTQQIKNGSTIYIEPMGGYETYLAAAFTKKHVPLIVVLKKDKADYIIHGTINHMQPSQSQPEIEINNSNTIENSGDSTQSEVFDQAYASGHAAAVRRAEYKASLGYSTASFAIIDPASSRIVFSYSSEKDGKNQLQNTAEDYAKHLKEFIEKSEKAKKKSEK